MTFKKMLLLLGAVAVLTAFVVPAAAQASPLWFKHVGEGEEQVEETATEEAAEALHVEGPLTFTTAGGLATGPCNTTLSGGAVNVNKMAAGAFEKGEIKGECPTNLPGCKAQSATAQNLPWGLTATTVGGVTVIDITEVTFQFHYSTLCTTTYGIPATLAIAGTITGGLEEATQCIEFKKAGDLVIEGKTEKVSLDGELCIAEPLTMHAP